MKHFDYFAPTEIIFGAGRVTEAGALAARYGKKAMLVTVPEFPAVAELYAKVKKSLADAGVACVHYDGVIPNPTTELVTRGAELAKAEGVDVVIGLGGGSSMDTAKAIAVEATHPGTAWDYNCHTAGPTEQTLPILAIDRRHRQPDHPMCRHYQDQCQGQKRYLEQEYFPPRSHCRSRGYPFPARQRNCADRF